MATTTEIAGSLSTRRIVTEASEALSGAGTDPRPCVDVGIVTFDTRDVTLDTIERVRATDHGCDVRILVRDNGSRDGTADAIADAFPGVELDFGAENLGFAAGMNTLLRRSRAPWFFALNSDAWPEPGALRALVDRAVATAAAAAVAPRLERPDGTLEHSTHPFPSVGVAVSTGLGAYRWVGRRRAWEQCLTGVWMHDRARAVDWAVGAALLLRREAVDDVGLFDERFFMYVEDLEWAWRARRRGWQVWFEPAAVVRHLGNASGARAYGRRRTRAHVQNAYRFYRRDHGRLSTSAWRAMNLAGAARLYLEGRLARDGDKAALWADHVRAHLSR